MRFLILFFVIFSLEIQAQNGTQESSDDAAMEILNQLKKDYDDYSAHKMDFSLELDLVDQGKEIQSGYLIQEGDKFVLDMEQQKIISDNITVWVYLKEQNEIQINDADFDEEDELMSPSSIFNLYESDDYIFVISNQSYEEGILQTQIEGKPTDSNSEYSKIRISLKDKSHQFHKMKIFSKDGNRYTLQLTKHIKGFEIEEGMFTLNPSEYKGVVIEDLRF